MTTTIATPIHYPCGDGQPVAETFDHLYAILITIEVLRLYLQHEQACILGNQFLYYEEGASNKRCAPDVMVIFGVEPGSRDNYKIWEEGEIPRVAFEMTSPSTKGEDEGFKKSLYAEIGIAEYWQFDPKGQWIKEKLRGFRLVNGVYEPIVNGHSEALGLRLEVAGKLISFYRLDNGEKLLIPIELYESRQEFQIKARQFQAEARQFQAEARQFQAEARQLQAEARQFEAKSQQFEEQLILERSTTESLQQQLDRYREQFGEL
jgi:Uma2 family endonuclease